MSKRFPLHVPIDNFGVRDNCLTIGGHRVTDISKDVGHLPFYAYDRQAIYKRVKKIKDSLPTEVLLHYAMKANPMPDVVNYVSGLTDGIDVASAGEIRVALESETSPDCISFAGPGKSLDELALAVSNKITINIESATELQRIISVSKEVHLRPRVAVRVNPDFELKASGMKMSGGPKQFGIDAELVPDVLRQIKQMDVEFVGFHIYCGSQNLRPDAICDAQSKSLELALQLSESVSIKPRSINIGGGFGVPYFTGDEALELDQIGNNLSALLVRLKRRLPSTELIVELGRYIVAEAGVYCCNVVDKKISRGHTFLVTNGGLHHHLSASGNFGQVIRKNYPLLIANRIDSEEIELVSVVGPLCTPLDVLGDRMSLSKAEIGDIVAVFQSGAYGFSASPHHFLSHPPPVEMLL